MDRLAIVTGGSKGIGKSVINKLISEGWETINLSRTCCDIENVINCNVDLNKRNLKNYLMDKLSTYVGVKKNICIVHNACAYYPGTVIDTSYHDLNESWKVNIIAAVIINQVVIPFMLPSSSIIYVGSTLSEMAVPNSLPYVITKHALIGLMRSTCQDISNRGIHTCCVCPGFTDTETLKKHLEGGHRSVDQAIKNVSMNRLIQPREIAEFILYCVNMPITNGAVLHTNLGTTNE